MVSSTSLFLQVDCCILYASFMGVGCRTLHVRGSCLQLTQAAPKSCCEQKQAEKWAASIFDVLLARAFAGDQALEMACPCAGHGGVGPHFVYNALDEGQKPNNGYFIAHTCRAKWLACAKDSR